MSIVFKNGDMFSSNADILPTIISMSKYEIEKKFKRIV